MVVDRSYSSVPALVLFLLGGVIICRAYGSPLNMVMILCALLLGGIGAAVVHGGGNDNDKET
jgi:small neutral amino acid transporter SnatA (MarC family)